MLTKEPLSAPISDHQPPIWDFLPFDRKYFSGWVGTGREAGVITGSLLHNPRTASRKPHLFSCGNGVYSHCIHVSAMATCPVTFACLCQVPEPTSPCRTSPLGGPLTSCPHALGGGGSWGGRAVWGGVGMENKRNTSALLILFTGHLTTTLFLNFIVVTLPPPLTHPLQVSESKW